jgi:hypothetical protein
MSKSDTIDKASTNGHVPKSNGSTNGSSTGPETWDVGGAVNMNHKPGTAESLVQELLSDDDVPDRAADLLAASLNGDHALSNFDADHMWYRRHALENNLEHIVSSAPPKGSFWVGKGRRGAAGLDGIPRPHKPMELHDLRESTDAAIERTMRSVGGWFLELLAKQSAERREVLVNEDDDGGLLSKFVGGGR